MKQITNIRIMADSSNLDDIQSFFKHKGIDTEIIRLTEGDAHAINIKTDYFKKYDKLKDAVMNSDLNKAKEAINEGADIHSRYDEALEYAVISGYFDMVKYLVKMGADVHAQNDEALKRAEQNDYTEIANFLKLCMKEDKMSNGVAKIMSKGV